MLPAKRFIAFFFFDVLFISMKENKHLKNNELSGSIYKWLNKIYRENRVMGKKVHGNKVWVEIELLRKYTKPKMPLAPPVIDPYGNFRKMINPNDKCM